MSPIKKEDIGTFTVSGKVKNKYLSKAFSFKVHVNNEAPNFEGDLSPKIEVKKLETK